MDRCWGCPSTGLLSPRHQDSQSALPKYRGLLLQIPVLRVLPAGIASGFPGLLIKKFISWEDWLPSFPWSVPLFRGRQVALSLLHAGHQGLQVSAERAEDLEELALQILALLPDELCDFGKSLLPLRFWFFPSIKWEFWQSISYFVHSNKLDR